MPAPWQETSTKVVVEFQRGNQGTQRVIQLKHSAASVPPQLAGRIQPAIWQAFMADIQQAADSHPYLVRPSASVISSLCLAGVVAAGLGCCVVNPDGGSYPTWLQQVDDVIRRHYPAFAAGGAALSLQRAQRSYWVQIDVTAVAVGQPGVITVEVPVQQKPGYEPAKQY